MGIANLDKTAALGVFCETDFDLNRAHLVQFAAGWAHGDILSCALAPVCRAHSIRARELTDGRALLRSGRP